MRVLTEPGANDPPHVRTQFGAVYMAMEYEWIADSYGPYKKMILGAMGLAILLVPISHIVGQKGGKAAQD